MSAVVVLASARQNLQGSAENPDEHAGDMAAPSNEASLTTRSNVISAALAARRSIAVSASALSNPAQASVLYLLR